MADHHLQQGDAEGAVDGPSATSRARRGHEHWNPSPSRESPGLGEAQQRQQHEAQAAAFSANSEITATTPRGTAWGGFRSATPEEDAPSTHPAARQVAEDAGPRDEVEEEEDPPGDDDGWRPSLAIGSIDAGRLGAREAARRHALQWDRIYAAHQARGPPAAAVARRRADARRAYEALRARAGPEDVLPADRLPAHRARCVRARTALLRRALREAPGGEGGAPMRANVAAALGAYEAGAIGFSDRYTLIYAGRVVDACRTYGEFTVDRRRRLDGYFERYGPGCLWWEPPLARGKGSVLAKRCTALDLDREDDSFLSDDEHSAVRYVDDSSHYKVPLGFRRDDSLTCRFGDERKRSVVATEESSPFHEPSSSSSKSPKRRREQGSEDAAAPSPTRRKRESAAEGRPEQGPTMFFDMLLDSGAELPVLLHEDFELLGYDDGPGGMSASSAVELRGAAGQTSAALCFELLAGLELGGRDGDGDGGGDGDHRPAAYSEARFLPTRVIKLPPAVRAPAHGAFSADRLSGMLPFLAYYCASAPGNGRLWLGERRAEVLGVESMPAGLVYDPFGGASGGGDDGRARRREWGRRIGAPGAAVRGLRRVTIESELEGGRRLVDREVIDEAGEEVRSSIRLLAKDGRLLGRWQQNAGTLKSETK